jgi:hypothetical protein
MDHQSFEKTGNAHNEFYKKINYLEVSNKKENIDFTNK